MNVTLPTRLVPVGEVRPGDLITEADSPDGPFYPVLKVAPGVLTIDARDADEVHPFPLDIPTVLTSAVLVRRPEQPSEVAAFLAQCPIVAPGPQVSALPSGGYAVMVIGGDDKPVVVVLQRVAPTDRHPDGWMPTPARWYVSTLTERPGGGLSIDFGAGWVLPDLDAAAVYALAARLA